VVSTIIKYTLESFSECAGVSKVVEVGRKSVPDGWATMNRVSDMGAHRRPWLIRLNDPCTAVMRPYVK